MQSKSVVPSDWKIILVFGGADDDVEVEIAPLKGDTIKVDGENYQVMDRVWDIYSKELMLMLC